MLFGEECNYLQFRKFSLSLFDVEENKKREQSRGGKKVFFSVCCYSKKRRRKKSFFGCEMKMVVGKVEGEDMRGKNSYMRLFQQ